MEYSEWMWKIEKKCFLSEGGRLEMVYISTGDVLIWLEDYRERKNDSKEEDEKNYSTGIVAQV